MAEPRVKTAATANGRRNGHGSATLASTAYERLREDIISAQFSPGQKLAIQHLCERYGMGLSPMREALNRTWVPAFAGMTKEGIEPVHDAPASRNSASSTETCSSRMSPMC